jgi:hypothetical protein
MEGWDEIQPPFQSDASHICRWRTRPLLPSPGIPLSQIRGDPDPEGFADRILRSAKVKQAHLRERAEDQEYAWQVQKRQ